METAQGQNRIWASKQVEEREEKETRKGNSKSGRIHRRKSKWEGSRKRKQHDTKSLGNQMKRPQEGMGRGAPC